MTKRAGPRFAIIPADAVTDPALQGADLRVLALLGRHIDKKGWCVRTQGRMADELTIARGTLQRSLGRLVDAGYVEVSHEKRRDGGQAANRYRVILDDQARADQLDLFSDFGTDAVRADAGAPPASSVRHPLPHLEEAPPASPRRGTQEERPLHRTSPSVGCAAAREAERMPANDLRPSDPVPTRTETAGAALRSDATGAVPSVAASETDAVPFLAPHFPPSPARVASAALEHQLRDAAAGAVSAISPGLADTSDVYRWIAAGCELGLDILPTIAGRAARHRGPPIRSWKYFEGAVLDAYQRRRAVEAAVAQPTTNIVPFDPRGPHAEFARPARRRSRFDEIDAAFDRLQGGGDLD